MPGERHRLISCGSQLGLVDRFDAQRSLKETESVLGCAPGGVEGIAAWEASAVPVEMSSRGTCGSLRWATYCQLLEGQTGQTADGLYIGIRTIIRQVRHESLTNTRRKHSKYCRMDCGHRRALFCINLPAELHKFPHLWAETNCCRHRILRNCSTFQQSRHISV